MQLNKQGEVCSGRFSARVKRQQDESEFGIPVELNYVDTLTFLRHNQLAPHSFNGDQREDTAWNVKRLPLYSTMLVNNNSPYSLRVGDVLSLLPPILRGSNFKPPGLDPIQLDAEYDTFPVLTVDRLHRVHLEERVMHNICRLVMEGKDCIDVPDLGVSGTILTCILELSYHQGSLVKLLHALLEEYTCLGDAAVNALSVKFTNSSFMPALKDNHCAFGTNPSANDGDLAASAHYFRDSLSTCLNALDKIHDIWYPCPIGKVKQLNARHNEPGSRVVCKILGNRSVSTGVTAVEGADKEYVSALFCMPIPQLSSSLPCDCNYIDKYELSQTLDMKATSNQLVSITTRPAEFVTARIRHSGPDGDIDSAIDSSVVLMPAKTQSSDEITLETRSKRKVVEELREAFIAFANKTISERWPGIYSPCPCGESDFSGGICGACKELIATDIYMQPTTDTNDGRIVIDLIQLFTLCDAVTKVTAMLGSWVRTHLMRKSVHLDTSGDPFATLIHLTSDNPSGDTALQMSRIAASVKNLFVSKQPEVVGKLVSVYSKKIGADGLVFHEDDMSLLLV